VLLAGRCVKKNGGVLFPAPDAGFVMWSLGTFGGQDYSGKGSSGCGSLEGIGVLRLRNSQSARVPPLRMTVFGWG